jgi:type IV pilus assembly protein PilO
VTNLQASRGPQEQLLRQRLLLGVPIAIGGLLAVVAVAALLVPQWLRLRSDSERLAELQALQQRIPLLRSQLDQSSLNQEKAERQQRRILSLIEGSGEFLTFLAQIDREAMRAAVELELYEPVAAHPAASAGQPPNPPAQLPGTGATPAPAKAPLEQVGLDSERVLLSARGNYPSLLAFLRGVEKLSLLTVPSQFTMALVDKPGVAAGPQPAGGEAAKPMIPELKLLLTYYKAPPDGLKPPEPPQPAALPE